MSVLEALGTAVPRHETPQAHVRAKAEDLLRDVAPELLEKMSVFETVGIRKRHFVRSLDWYLEPHGWEERSRIFVDDGVDLLETATRQALERAALPPEAIDGVILVSTTGLSTPSLDARLANRVGLRPDASRVPVWGLGCAGGVAGVRLAADLARANPDKRYLLLTLELCSLAFNLNDFSVRAFVANTLFADGAAAAIVRGDATQGASLGRFGAGTSHQWRDTEDVMGWDVMDDGLRVVFSRRIPGIVSTQLGPVVESFLKQNDARVDRPAFHPGGTKVLKAYEESLGLTRESLEESWGVLREYGNMSSPTVLFVLQEALHRRALGPDETALLAALGPGFTAELALLHGCA